LIERYIFIGGRLNVTGKTILEIVQIGWFHDAISYYSALFITLPFFWKGSFITENYPEPKERNL